MAQAESWEKCMTFCLFKGQALASNAPSSLQIFGSGKLTSKPLVQRTKLF